MDNIQLETDAEALVLMLSNVEKHMTHVLGAILVEVSNLLNLQWTIDVTLIKRSGNMVAHNMAKMVQSLKESRMIFPEPPICVFNALDSDTKALQLINTAS